MKKHYSLLLAFLVAFSSLFVSCGENEWFEELNKCRITVIAADGGEVKISKYLQTSELILLGSEIDIVATPNDGYVFTGWYMNDSAEPISNDAVFNFVVTKDVTFTACFTKQLNLTVCSAGNGRVSFKDIDGTSRIALYGTEVTVVATPDEDCDFIGWFIGEAEEPVSIDAEYTFTVTENLTLTAKFKRRKTYINGYEYVDLALPSGLKWATMNVGATSPEDYGGYYAWGETEENNNYEWSTYKWRNGSYDTMTKYCTDSYYGTVDNKTVLDPEDDVAHVKWGGSWRMPTEAEQDELRNNCTWTWTTQNGVNGYKVIGPNGNSIFLPAAGYRYGAEVYSRGSYGGYWSSSLGSSYSNRACSLYFDGEGYGRDNGSRFNGFSVRPVSE